MHSYVCLKRGEQVKNPRAEERLGPSLTLRVRKLFFQSQIVKERPKSLGMAASLVGMMVLEAELKSRRSNHA